MKDPFDWSDAPAKVREMLDNFVLIQVEEEDDDHNLPNGKPKCPKRFWPKLIKSILEMDRLAVKYDIMQLRYYAGYAVMWLYDQGFGSIDPGNPARRVYLISDGMCGYEIKKIDGLFRSYTGPDGIFGNRTEMALAEGDEEQPPQINKAQKVEANKQKLEDAMKTVFQDDPTGKTIFDAVSKIVCAAKEQAVSEQDKTSGADVENDQPPRKRVKN